jgi:hypothetical protein
MAPVRFRIGGSRLAAMPDIPTTQYVSPGGKPFGVRCEDRADYLYAVVTGPKGDADVGVALWRVLAGEVASRRSRGLLVDARLTGGRSLSPQDLADVVARFVGSPLEGVRIAYVENDARNVAALEHGAIAAAGMGFSAQVFPDFGSAERWLRYGSA